MPMARLTAPHFKPSQPLSSSPVGRITDSRHAQAIRLHELQTRRQVRAAAVPAQVDRAIPCAGRALRFAGRRWRTDQGQASCACRTVCTTLYDQGHPPVVAHRYIVQQRMKRPGAWWREHNAEHMLALRLNRANRQWDVYWQRISKNQHDQLTTSV